MIGRDFPSVECAVVYRDIRTPGQLERFYQAVQDQPGRLFARGEVERVEGNGRLTVHLRESLLGDACDLEADLVVLAVGMVPNAADGEAIRTLHDAQRRAEKGESETQREEARKIVAELAPARGNRDPEPRATARGPTCPSWPIRFHDSHFICFPYETRRTGIYAAGTLRAPMDAAQAAEDGWGAAMKAIQCIAAAERGEAVHPRSGDARHSGFLPPALHAVQALHRGVPLRDAQRGREGDARSSTRCAAAAAASAWAPVPSGSSRSPTTRWTSWPA